MTTNGERGPTGDHGQAGAEGKEGVEGPTGKTGRRGVVGPEGPEGRSRSTFNRMQTLAIFLFVVLAGLALSVRAESQDRRIEANMRLVAQTQWDNCIRSAAFVHDAWNAAWRELADVEGTQKVDAALAQRRIAAYKKLLILPEPTVEQCGRRP